jgi:hypothetical protein
MRGYPKQALPARVSTEQLASLYEHYGVTTYWEGGQAAIASRPPEARQGFAQGYGAGGYNGPPQQFGNGSSGQYPSYGGGPGYQGYQGYGPGQAYSQGQAYGQGYGNPGYGPGGQRYAQGQGYGPQGYGQYPQQGQGYGQYPQQSQGYGPSGPPMMGGHGQMGGMANNPQPQMRRMMRQHMQQYGTGQGYGPSGPPMMRGQGQMGSMGQGYGPPSGSSQPQQPGYGPMGPGYGQPSPQNGGGQQ